MSSPRQVRLSTGFEVALDGDLLAIIEALYGEITLGSGLNTSFETMRSEILSLIDQMTEADRRAYLAESLFLNSVTYENEMLAAYVRRLSEKAAVAPSKAPARRPAPIATKKLASRKMPVKKAASKPSLKAGKKKTRR
ncbi:MAG: hypothetical protein ABI672_11415 [Vicinamibacteria bacterium]